MGTSSIPNQNGADEQQNPLEIDTYEAPWHMQAINQSVIEKLF